MTSFRAGNGYQFVVPVTINPSNVTAGSVSQETFTPTALVPLDIDSAVYVTAPSLEAGLFLIQSRITAKGTLELSIWNTTGADIDPASQQFNVIVL